MKFRLVLPALLGLLILPASRASIIHVPGDQPTIQAGINAANNGDTVLVDPGTYTENINFLGKAITVTSSGGPAGTIIDGAKKDSVVIFNSSEGRDSVLNGFTLQNGLTTFEGGGILIASSPTITRNVIRNNGSCNGGGGIGIGFASPLIQGNLITGNSQMGCSGGIGGGGISVRGASSAQIIGNKVSENSWGGAGGGITLFAAGTPLVRNNIIAGNVAQQAGGIWVANAGGEQIVQNLIYNNTATQGGGIYMFAGASGPIVVNNTIANNKASQGSALYTGGSVGMQIINNLLIGRPGQNAVFCDPSFGSDSPAFSNNDAFSPNGSGFQGTCSGQSGQNGNIHGDALFVDRTHADYRLQPGSPAIDTGTNSAPNLPRKDLAGKRRIVDGDSDGTATVDMGAYEFQ